MLLMEYSCERDNTSLYIKHRWSGPKECDELYIFNYKGNKINVIPFLKGALPVLYRYTIESHMSVNEKFKASLQLNEMLDELMEIAFNDKYKECLKTMLSTVVSLESRYTDSITNATEYVYTEKYHLAFTVLKLYLDAIITDSKFENIIKEVYGTTDPLDGLKYKTDLSVGICVWVTINWAYNIVVDADGLFGVPKKISEYARVIGDFDELFLLKLIKGNRSKFMKYLTGKCTEDELIEERKKKYKTKPSDFEVDAIITYYIGAEASKINKIIELNSDSILNDILQKASRSSDKAGELFLKAYKSNINTKNSLSARKKRIEELEKDLKAATSEIDVLKTELDKSIKSSEHKKYKISELKKEIDDHKNKVIELRKRVKIVEEAKNFKNQIDELNAEVDRLNSLNTSLENNLTKMKRERSELLHKVRKLDFYEEFYGDILEASDDDEITVENQEITPLDKVVAELKDFKLVICTFSTTVERELTKMGLNVRTVSTENDSVLNSTFDIGVIYAHNCSHKAAYALKDRSKQVGALSLYYSGANNEKMLRSLHAELNKTTGEK